MMFKLVKENVDILEVLSKELNKDFKKVGEDTFTPEDNECPFCGHRDCFRVKTTGKGEGFYKCFSCDQSGDVLEFVSKARKISVRDTANLLAKEYNVNLPNDYTPVQEIFNLSALYYHNCLESPETKPYAELGQKTPKEYQEQIRKHKPESLAKFQVGWSDGGLVKYLSGLGFEKELLEKTGLINKKGQDFLPSKAFIYPHYVNGRVSHFTFKDPMKKVEYQLKNTNKLNGHCFYNSDSIKGKDTVIIVEGENDLISVDEHGWQDGLIACIGQISTAQLDWISTTLAHKHIVTIFDNDDAGDKYRDKVSKLSSRFASLTQVKLDVPGIKDIDEFLGAGRTLGEAIENYSTSTVTKGINGADIAAEESAEQEETTSKSEVTIVERGNCYYKIKYKEGEATLVKLTNFIMKLRNIFKRGEQREREIVIIREDGNQSQPVIVASECKVSVKLFKSFIANAIDASFYGTERDLDAVWEYVYDKEPERIVHLPPMVGRLDEFGGWVFRDVFISDTGVLIYPDKEGIIWLNGNSSGIKPVSLEVEVSSRARANNLDIPQLICDKTPEEREKILRAVITNLAKNLGNVGLACTLMGWAKASAYADILIDKIHGFPFIMIWGRHGRGKTAIARWLASIYGTDECGYGLLPQFKSGVGFSRKIAYYSCLPVILDEFRADKQADEISGVIRGWYQKYGRTMGTKEGFGVKVQHVRSNFIFSGQDMFTDAATRQRCVPIRIPKDGRETTHSFNQLESYRSSKEISAIGYHWILETTRTDMNELFKRLTALDKVLVSSGCEVRTAKNWACVGVFAQELADEYFPGFNYVTYLMNTVKLDTIDQDENDILNKFFSLVEVIQADERSVITKEHMKVIDGVLYMWWEGIFTQLSKWDGGRGNITFSSMAVRNALKEEPYFIHDAPDRKVLVTGSRQRNVVAINLNHEKTPQCIKNIGASSASN